MKLRTKLVIAFFFLAIVPLVSITLYSFHTSQEAFCAAVEAESRETAEGMNQRMTAVREDLDQFLGSATRWRFAAQEAEWARQSEETDLRFRAQMAEFGGLVEAYEFIPAPPPIREQPLKAEPARPAQPLPSLPTPRPIVIAADWMRAHDCNQPEDGNEPNEACEHETEGLSKGGEEVVAWISTLVTGGARLIEMAVEDPEALEKALSDHGGEFTTEMIEAAVEEGQLLAAEALEESEEMELALAESSLRIREKLLQSIPERLRLTTDELERLESRRARAEMLIGRRLDYEVRDGEYLVGHVRAQVSPSEVLGFVLAAARRDEGEVPFAIDSDGEIHTLNPADTEVLEDLEITRCESSEPGREIGDWMVVQSTDPVSGTEFGIARPVGDALDEIRNTAVRNLGFGLLLVCLAGWGILPLSRRITRHLATLTRAADDLAGGDLSTRVPVRSRDEFGHLAAAFNRMAGDLEEHQTLLLEQERLRREQEVETRLLEMENERKGGELEEARQFQISLLPDHLPEIPGYQIAVAMRTATEVGGDYYDYREAPGGEPTIALGDATGHGAGAGTMVTAAKSLFTAATDLRPEPFLNAAAEVVRTMRLGRMNMALAVARLEDDGLTIAMAGMPPLLVHRQATGSVEEIVVPGVPLGSFRSNPYREVRVPLLSGDTLLMMSDGFPELPDVSGEPLGYERTRDCFSAAAGQAPEHVISELMSRADRWRGEQAQADDITFLVLQKQ